MNFWIVIKHKTNNVEQISLNSLSFNTKLTLLIFNLLSFTFEKQVSRVNPAFNIYMLIHDI